MRVAALYDVHGMPWPLEAVLSEIASEPLDAVVFGGDIVQGPCPERTLELACAVDEAQFIRGNCDREPSAHVCSHLDGDRLRWLRELPMMSSLDGVLYCHSTPGDDMPIVTAETPAEVLEELYSEVAEGTVVIGHTHHQFDRRARGARVVNAGSVGMPYEGEVAAFWALVEDGEPRFRRTPFDVGRAIAEIERSGWPDASEFVAENLRVAACREEAIRHFESLRE